MKNTILLCIVLAVFTACSSDPDLPKPRGYPRVVYPTKAYQPFRDAYCGFTFEYPKYAKILKDSLFFEEKTANQCWFNLYYPDFDATVHCSYYPITSRKLFDKFTNDAYTLAGKHNVKADYINEINIKNPNNVVGIVFDLSGPAASPFQFYLTDSTQNFLRGALYFNTQVRPDSLAPVLDFLKTDIMRMVETFQWQ